MKKAYIECVTTLITAAEETGKCNIIQRLKTMVKQCSLLCPFCVRKSHERLTFRPGSANEVSEFHLIINRSVHRRNRVHEKQWLGFQRSPRVYLCYLNTCCCPSVQNAKVSGKVYINNTETISLEEYANLITHYRPLNYRLNLLDAYSLLSRTLQRCFLVLSK